MQAKLVIVGGKANKRDVLLKLPTIIGRSREADLTVAHPMVSRKHCELFEVDGLLKIRDLGSLNGTLVKGERTKEAALYPEDEFTVGPLTFRAEYEYTGEIASAPPVEKADEEAAPDFQILGDEDQGEAEGAEAEPAAPSDEPDAAGQPVGIAPDEGGLPDFEAWGEAGGGDDQPETEPPADEAEPAEGPPLLQPTGDEEPLLQPAGDEEPPMVELRVEDEEAEASDTPAPEEPDMEPDVEPDIEPDFEEWDETRTQAAVDLSDGEEPVLQPAQPEETPQADAPADATSQGPEAPAAQAGASAEAPAEEKEKPAGSAPPTPKAPPAPPQKEKAEQPPDFLAALGDAPQEEEEEEPEEEEEEEESPEDQALNDFLKGLT